MMKYTIENRNNLEIKKDKGNKKSKGIVNLKKEKHKFGQKNNQ